MKSKIACLLMLAATNVFAERVIDFPVTVEGMVECQRTAEELKGHNPSYRMVGSAFLFGIQGTDKFMDYRCGSPELIVNSISPSRAIELLKIRGVTVTIYDQADFPKLIEQQRQRRQQSELEQQQQRQKVLSKYGL